MLKMINHSFHSSISNFEFNHKALTNSITLKTRKIKNQKPNENKIIMKASHCSLRRVRLHFWTNSTENLIGIVCFFLCST